MRNISKVIVYGSCKGGFPNHHVLHEAKYLGEVNIPGKYTMISLGAFPGLLPNGCSSYPLSTIRGELYEVDDLVVRNLDHLEGHPHFYQRELVDTDKGQAWVYRMSDKYIETYVIGRYDNLRVVESGVWEHV